MILDSTLVDFTDLVKKSATIDPFLLKMILRVSLVAGGMAITLAILNIGYNYIKNALQQLTNQQAERIIDINEIARTLIILALIGLYTPIITASMGAIEMVSDKLKMTVDGEDKLMEEYVTKAYDYYFYTNEKIIALEEKVKAEKDEAKREELNRIIEEEREKLKKGEEIAKDASGETIRSAMGWSIGNIIAQRAIGLVMTVIGLIVGNIALGIASLGLKILLVLGPLAFAFSILPVFKNQVSVWASATLNFAFASMTMDIIHALDVQYLFSLSIFPLDFENSIAYNFSKVVLYAMPFWFTAKYVGKGEGGAFVGKMMGMATAALAMVMTGGAGAVGGAKGTLGNIIKSGSKTTDKNTEK